MLTKLKIERFKNFKAADLTLGPFTVLIGANASGKSNIRDAFRFLHGISRGYNLAETAEEKYAGGILQWQGIRGGMSEIAYSKSESFKISVEFTIEHPIEPFRVFYFLEVVPNIERSIPKIIGELLHVRKSIYFFDDRRTNYFYRTLFEVHKVGETYPYDTEFVIPNGIPLEVYDSGFVEYKPVLTQFSQNVQLSRSEEMMREAARFAEETVATFNSIHFLDLSPEAMHRPSFPGQTVLGDRGENLSSVLQAMCEDIQQKKALTEWIQELTPMDVIDFEFIPDQTGRILVNFIESNGRRTSAYSASDGTLRFLGMLAALLGPEPARIYFIEELENGLHPARLHLLLQLIEQQTAAGKTQVIATTHSPQLLSFLSPETREYASLVYRLSDTSEGRIVRILDIPEVAEIIEKQDLARLHETGWFEDAMAFLDEAEVVG